GAAEPHPADPRHLLRVLQRTGAHRQHRHQHQLHHAQKRHAINSCPKCLSSLMVV
ncbi:hypothetical protein JOQ06_022675, partial [Pogonophryne albipinna]